MVCKFTKLFGIDNYFIYLKTYCQYELVVSKMDRKRSFASKLSWKVVIITSIIFFFALVTVAIYGGRIMEFRSKVYIQQTLQTAVLDIQDKMKQAEQTGYGMGRTIEAFQHSGVQLDTAKCFKLMAETVLGNPFIKGAGIYYQPYFYMKDQKYTGIYVNLDENDENLVYEWDSNESYAEDGWDYFVQDWYDEARLKGVPVWTPPYFSYMEDGGYEYIDTFSYPLKDSDGEFFGVMAVDLSLNWLKERLLELKPYPNSNIAIIDNNLNVICNPLSNDPFDGTVMDRTLIPGFDFIFTGEESIWHSDNDDENFSMMRVREDGTGAFCILGQMSNGWKVFITCSYKDVFADMFNLWLLLLAIAVLGMLLLYFFCFKTINTAAVPISRFAEAAAKITDGHFDIPIPEVNSEDEIQDLGNALSYMQASVTSYISELRMTMASKQKLENELDVARKIQTQMLSTDFPTFKNIELYARSTPAKQVGGDLYDFFVTDSGIYFIVGDVSGKGVPAALLMAISIAAFRASGKKGRSSQEIVSLINETFCRSNEDMMFVTLVVGHIDSETNVMDFCNAGHNPMVLIGPDGKSHLMKEKTNVACGIMPKFPYEGESVTLEHGSRILVYSDGITEAENNIKELYGESRLLAWAEAHGTGHTSSDKAAVDSLSVSVGNFTDGAEQNDDMTIMSISV